MKLIESELTCQTCGERMSCLLTGPPSQPNTRASYLCPNMDWQGICQKSESGPVALNQQAASSSAPRPAGKRSKRTGPDFARSPRGARR